MDQSKVHEFSHEYNGGSFHSCDKLSEGKWSSNMIYKLVYKPWNGIDNYRYIILINDSY